MRSVRPLRKGRGQGGQVLEAQRRYHTLFHHRTLSEGHERRQQMAMQGGAPDDVEFVDVEEEYVVDENGHGSWQVREPSSPPCLVSFRFQHVH